jgi:hypothetical protein
MVARNLAKPRADVKWRMPPWDALVPSFRTRTPYGTHGCTVLVNVVSPAAGVAEPIGVVADVHAA